MTKPSCPVAPVTRRTFMSAAAAALAAPALVIPGRARAADGPVVFVTWGGVVAKAVKELLAEPFTRETGIPVVIADGPDLAKVKAQIQTGNIEWDILDLPGAMAMSGSKSGFWEPIDTDIVRTGNLLLPNPTSDLVLIDTYAGGVGWNTGRHADGAHPTDIAEYFDVQRFPGTRTLRARISETLEMALVASGVPVDALYPLDVERGFKALDEFKPHVRKWVSETAQMTGLLQSEEVDFSYVFSSRVRAAQAGGIPLAMSMKQCVIGSLYYGVVKGSPRREAAMKFIDFAIQPQQNAALCSATTTVPNVKGANELMDADARQWAPDLGTGQHIVISDAYWADHFETLEARFKEWLLT
jgi:putative spermidine/putrescine transport system substrate-binding protein